MDAWRKLDERPVHDGYRRVVRRRFELPDGTRADYEVKDEPSVATILALTDNREVVLVREYRVGPEQVLLELPGGAIDAGESPVQAARRELLEETGYEGELRELGTILDCAYSTRVKYAFAATECRPVAGIEPHPGEFVEVVLLPLPAFREHLRSGRLTDAAVGYLALDALGLLA